MMKKYLLSIFFAIIFLLSACEIDDNDMGIEMIFEETQCANPWNTLPNNNNYLFEIHQYLNSEGLELFSISIENINGNEVHCDACTCSSGRIIIIRIPEPDKEKAESIGFISP